MNGRGDDHTLPEGWALTDIATVTDVVAPCDPRRQPDRPFTYVDISGIDNERLVVAETKKLLGSEAPSRARRPLEEGDVVFSNVRTYLRNVARIEGLTEPAIASTGFTVLRPNAAMLTDYLFRYVSSDEFLRLVTPRQTGTHYPATSDTVVRKQVIPLPPLAEQHRIAERLEAIGVRNSVIAARLQSAQTAVGRFRTAVFAAACAGRLSRDWREEHTPGGSNGLPSGWTQDTVEGLAADAPRAIQSGPFGSNLKHSEFQSTGKLVIGIDNVLDGQFTLGREHRISDRKFEELRKYQARPLDVLITVMATVGRVCVVPEDIEPAIITKHVYRITADHERVSPRFLMLALRGHPKVREQLHYQTRGQTRPGINGQIVKGLTIDVPPLDEQEAIVERVEAMMAIADDVSRRIDGAAATLGHTSRVSLVKAFRGELVATEAARAAEEGRHFESAEELLARVGARVGRVCA